MTSKIQETIQFELLSNSVSECIDQDKWVGDDVVSLSEQEVAEITGGDDKPFYVEFVALYEGVSNNMRNYSEDAVKSCVDAMVGVNMYKGHIEPGTSSWKYREPVGRIVAARLDKVNIDGKDVPAAKGKAYITEADPKLRADIKRKMAGSVSILGNAKMVSQYGDTVKTVVQMHKPLKSVDFCNPGSAGLSHAGVTAVVSEMDATVSGSDTEQHETEDQIMTKKLTKDELLAEYKQEITALVGEQIEDQIQEIATGRKEIAEQKVKLTQEKQSLEASVQEMTSKFNGAEKVAAEWKSKYESERDARIASQLELFANEKVAEMISSGDHDKRIVDLASKRIKAQVVDGDLDKSKKNYVEQLNGAIDEVSEMAELFGSKQDSDLVTKKRDGNRSDKGNATKKLSKILSSELNESMKKRTGESS